MKKIRLSKFLAASGAASRRAAEQLIFDGLVEVNGMAVLLPQTLVHPLEDRVTCRGEPVRAEEEKVYFLLNKPAGYVCSEKRLKNEKLVSDLFKEEPYRLFTVGRLDKETEGLIILTNDGHFAQNLIHPSKNISREYLVKVDQDIQEEHLKRLSEGTFVEGSLVKPLKVRKVRRGTVKISVKEGKKHEVRLLIEAAGLQLTLLRRIRLGSYTLGNLPTGSYRSLTQGELRE